MNYILRKLIITFASILLVSIVILSCKDKNGFDLEGCIKAKEVDDCINLFLSKEVVKEQGNHILININNENDIKKVCKEIFKEYEDEEAKLILVHFAVAANLSCVCDYVGKEINNGNKFKHHYEKINKIDCTDVKEYVDFWNKSL
jgi:hypothetical protein